MDPISNIEDIIAIKSHIRSWKGLTPEEMQFERLGGLSNQMWKVISLRPGVNPEAIILRKFGAHGNLVDREKENYILKSLAEQGVGPKFYAGTNEYRIEKFYDSETLTPAELAEAKPRRKMAKAIAELHKVQLAELDKTPYFQEILDGKGLIRMAKEKARKSTYTPIKAQLVEDVLALASEEEITFLKSILPSPDSVVFSHNDAHSQNVLVLKNTKDFMLIDYEYSHYNYRGYDIANCFNELMFDYNVTEYPYYSADETKFPDDEELKEFIQYYLLFNKFKLNHLEIEAVINEKDGLIDYIEKHYNMDAFLAEVDEIAKEVKICMMFSHFYWAMWSILMSGSNDIKFDYIHFAHKRLELYRNLKRKLFRRKPSALRIQSQQSL